MDLSYVAVSEDRPFALARTGLHLAALLGERIAAFTCSGEINYRVAAAQPVIERVFARYALIARCIDRTDGVSLEFKTWRFNLRGSNTEPLLRLNVENRGDGAAVQGRVAELEALIREPV